MLRQKGSLCEIGACTDQVSGVDACVQRAAAADLAGWSEYQLYAGLAQRQSGALVQRRSRFRNSHPAPEGDHAGRPGAYLNRGFDSVTEGFDSLWCWGNRIRRLYQWVDVLTGVNGPHKVVVNRRFLQFTTGTP